jgi:hypothetical protein
MYCTYTYKAGATVANILSDVIAILSGTTSVSSLSSSCVSGQTNINASVYSAGWTVIDTSFQGSNVVALSAAYADTSSYGKYISIDLNTTGYILLKGWETWTPGIGGTNLSYNSDLVGYAQRLNTVSGGVLYIYANKSCIHMFSFQSSVFGNSNNNTASFIAERTRAGLWDTPTNNLYPLLVSGYWIGVYTPRYPSNWGLDVMLNNAVLNYMTYGTIVVTTNLPTQKVKYGPDGEFYHLFQNVWVTGMASNNFLGGNLSAAGDFYLTTLGVGGFGDHITYNGNDYIIWNVDGTARVAFRNG